MRFPLQFFSSGGEIYQCNFVKKTKTHICYESGKNQVSFLAHLKHFFEENCPNVFVVKRTTRTCTKFFLVRKSILINHRYFKRMSKLSIRKSSLPHALIVSIS